MLKPHPALNSALAQAGFGDDELGETLSCEQCWVATLRAIPQFGMVSGS